MRQALELALEALEGFYEYGYDRRECFEHITAIKEALAQPEQEGGVCGRCGGWVSDPVITQPEQEPVAWVCYGSSDSEMHDIDFEQKDVDALPVGTMLYTTPPQRSWVGLTDEEIAELHYEIKVQLMGAYKTEDIYRAIEAKLKEKNNGNS